MAALEQLLDFIDKNNAVVEIKKSPFNTHDCYIELRLPEEKLAIKHIFDLEFISAMHNVDTTLSIYICGLIRRLSEGRNEKN